MNTFISILTVCTVVRRDISKRTIRHSIPNISNISFIFAVNLCDPAFPTLLPLFTLGLSRPSNTNKGIIGVSSKLRVLKNKARSSGFSPSFPPNACRYHNETSIPTRSARRPEGFSSNPSATVKLRIDWERPVSRMI